MSTLVDHQIKHWAHFGGITPFDMDLINPASINLRIGTAVQVEAESGRLQEIDLRDFTAAHPFWVQPGEWLLTHTAELITLPPNMEAEVCLRSSAARAGWDHCLAGYVDPGWSGKLTLEFQNVRRYKQLPLYPGQQLCQLRLRYLSTDPVTHYGQTGRYQGDQSVNACQDPTICHD